MLEGLLDKHKDDLNYIQLVAGAKWMLDSGHWILCYKLGYQALLMDPERPEAAEVLFFLFLHRNETALGCTIASTGEMIRST